ncbi:MAG: hypothetical protein LBE36_11660 [Flavobacteriaceae bacterium]|jgi:hypothetical protein|nr:hypothetical protein [Flavobacteriaceae bacterium]
MKNTILALSVFLSGLFFAQNHSPELTKYVDFLDRQNVSAKDYVLGLFQKYDIVVLCERHHGEMTQYDLIYDITSSPYFEKNVGNIFTEVGSISSRENVQNFIHTKFNNGEEKTRQQTDMYRNIFPYGIWEKTNFYDFFGKLNTLNSKLNKSKKINLFVTDIRKPDENEWSSAKNLNKYFIEVAAKRDSIIAQNVIKTFDSLKHSSDRKKALVIMNYRHAFSKTLGGDKILNVGDYLSQYYGERFANVLINSSVLLPEVLKNEENKPKAFQGMQESLAQGGKWDAAFKVAGKENLGFDFQNSPFGKDDFDKWVNQNPYNYQDIFTGFVFYLPIEKHMDSFGVKDLVKGYEEEVYKKQVLVYQSLGADTSSMSIETVQEVSEVQTEKPYEDLDKMLIMRDQWLGK